MATTIGTKIPTISSTKYSPFKKKGNWVMIMLEQTKPPLLGHIKLTHSFILKEEPPPRCSYGNQYTVKYILIECTDLTHTQRKFYNINSIKELFGKIDAKNILFFC